MLNLLTNYRDLVPHPEVILGAITSPEQRDLQPRLLRYATVLVGRDAAGVDPLLRRHLDRLHAGTFPPPSP